MDWTVALVVLMAFASVAGVVFVGGQIYVDRARLGRRLNAGATKAGAEARAVSGIGAIVADTFPEERFGVDDTLRQKLRKQLIRSGFFNSNAILIYVYSRFATVVVLPLSIYIMLALLAPGMSWLLRMVLVSATAGLGIILPDAYLSHRMGRLAEEFRLIFPDFLDLMIVCMSAGLSIEASMERIRGQLSKRSKAFGQNLELVGAEMRAGRSSMDVLNALADRLGIEEAASLVAVLRQSIELGGDVIETMRVFSDEMREKRILRAEETANKLPVKMVGPLAIGIFPVILLIALLPVILKLLKVAHQVGH
jgi:tight adherence protein C